MITVTLTNEQAELVSEALKTAGLVNLQKDIEVTKKRKGQKATTRFHAKAIAFLTLDSHVFHKITENTKEVSHGNSNT